MKTLPLIISVKAKNWRGTDPESGGADAEFQMVKPQVRARDNDSCRFCGFRSPKGGYYMQVHHRNDDHSDNRPDNLVTTCMHCHAVHHIGFWGQDRGAGREASIIYLPEISQAHLSHLCRTILVARRYCEKVVADPKEMEDRKQSARQIAESAEVLMDRFRSREALAEARLGSSDPVDLANALLKLNDEDYERRIESLSPYRLLLLGPHCKERGTDMMPQIVDDWLGPGGPYGNIKPAVWKNLVQNLHQH
ncbi:HNH endonuclease [Bosea sp. ANAM02]|uniref:HNH endonuclease n=1 Tax=Bosea sp. ANAM02 TaxID=2020412 RepID=UPI00140EC38B|nr:HNH endonuclease [Bosea sp. ANAM02]BCB21840.1 hypothetical protein OCUBac02_47340 [Bosea sp. ANAM02]